MINLFNSVKEDNKVYYCKHIAPGVCAYLDETIFIGEETLKKMDRSFSGKPIFIDHRKVDPATEKQDAVGYVIESFYLPEDGTHWAKLLIIEDSAHNLIKQGWKVSNAYEATGFGVGGEWHNVPYNREVTDGHYTHLALVDNPRYEEAMILTPEEFKKYKEEKKAQLEQLQNSKSEAKTETKQGETKMSWKLWSKKEVNNSDEISKVMVELSDGSTISVAEMVNSVEKDLKEKEAKKNKCNEDDIKNKKVKVNGEDMTVGELIEAFEKKDKKNEDDEDKEDKEKKDKKNESEDEDKEKSEKKDKKNESEEEDEEKKDKKNEDEEDKEDEEKKDKKNSKDLLEAEEKTNSKEFTGIVADTMSIKLARGQERYGSGK